VEIEPGGAVDEPVTTDRRRTRLHPDVGPPEMTSLTRCVRAKSRSAVAGSSERSRTNSPPISRAFSMLPWSWRWASESMRSGASSGVST
jgi:hypothetical protein